MAAAIPEGFHYETRYVVLNYLGLVSQEKIPGPTEGTQPAERPPLERDVAEKIKTEIEEELKLLHDEINKAFTSTGFECHTSPVFSPANPESSIEDCLAHLGEQIFQELAVQLQAALQNILSKPLEYEVYKEQANQVASHTSGWNKVLISLVLLQQLLIRQSQQPLKALVELGVKYIEETDADYIIQQGGWGTVFSLEAEEEEQGETDDSNDIYIFTSDNSGQVSPPEPLTVTSSWQAPSLPASLSTSQSWHTEGLPVSLGTESWQQLSIDPEDMKSLDSNGGGEERSENNSSNSDIVHVEKEEITEAVESQEVELKTPVSTAAIKSEALPALQTAPVEGQPSAAVEKTDPLSVSGPIATPVIEETNVKPAGEMASESSELHQSTSLQEIRRQLEEIKKGDWEDAPKTKLEEEVVEKEKKVEITPLAEPEDTKEIVPAKTSTSVLFYGGAAAFAMLAVAVGVALAWRRRF